MLCGIVAGLVVLSSYLQPTIPILRSQQHLHPLPLLRLLLLLQLHNYTCLIVLPMFVVQQLPPCDPLHLQYHYYYYYYYFNDPLSTHLLPRLYLPP